MGQHLQVLGLEWDALNLPEKNVWKKRVTSFLSNHVSLELSQADGLSCTEAERWLAEAPQDAILGDLFL